MRGRPVLGTISGLFLGLFIAIALFQWKVRPLEALTVYGLPALFGVIGLALALWAPFARGRAAAMSAPAEPEPPPAATEEPPPPAAMEEPGPPESADEESPPPEREE